VELEDVAALTSAVGLAALAAADQVADGDPLAAASALRAGGIEPRLAAAALTQAVLRRRARTKFGADADRLLFTRTGLEQATRAVVANRRAERLKAAGATRVADLGCGIGADTIAFARTGLAVVAVDRDPVSAAIAEHNVRTLGLAATVSTMDATATDLSDVDAVFCDPARRKGTRRVFDPAAYEPPWDFVAALPQRVPRAVLKLAPGIDHALLPDGAEGEWVSVDGDVVEATVWCGPLAQTPRRATVIRGPGIAALEGTGQRQAPVKDGTGQGRRPIPHRPGRSGRPVPSRGRVRRSGRRAPGRRDDRLRLHRPAGAHAVRPRLPGTRKVANCAEEAAGGVAGRGCGIGHDPQAGLGARRRAAQTRPPAERHATGDDRADPDRRGAGSASAGTAGLGL
jgi:SAM-dependent methyltransferase